MINNDILRRLRFALNISDETMMAILKEMGSNIELPYLHAIMAKQDAPEYIPCRDVHLCTFLDGLIIHKRGEQPDRERPQPKKILTNNDILQKLRIALSMRSEDVIEILKVVDFRLSKGELGAFSRKPDHRNYKECGDQVIRNFLNGLTQRNRNVKPKD